MIKILKRGQYQLIETKGQTKILVFDNQKTYAWINAGDIGEILVTTHKTHKADCILAMGNYRMYEVVGEQAVTNQMHLELHIGNGMWQGYLLPTGFPTDIKKKNRIIPTKELITKPQSHEYQGLAWL